MSEDQYYEFQAVDRSLTSSEMAELRGLTSCASITPTRLQNTYHYGDFRGTDPIAAGPLYQAAELDRAAQSCGLYPLTGLRRQNGATTAR